MLSRLRSRHWRRRMDRSLFWCRFPQFCPRGQASLHRTYLRPFSIATYGLMGSLATLSSEIERTVAVDLLDDRRRILKTSTRPEAVDSFRFQAAAIAGLPGTAGFVAPEVHSTSDGALVFENEGICGYLQTRLEGIALHQAQPTPDLLFRTGSALARLDLALDRVRLPATDRPILWHIGCWPRLMEFAR